jgi:hypothetical protein
MIEVVVVVTEVHSRLSIQTFVVALDENLIPVIVILSLPRTEMKRVFIPVITGVCVLLKVTVFSETPLSVPARMSLGVHV